MTENDELEIFAGAELVEPSPRVDAAVLAAARSRRGRGRRRAALALTSLAAVAVAAAVVTGIALRSGLDGEPPTPGGPPAALAIAPHVGDVEDVESAIDRLRLEVEQIGEMAELVAEERPDEREAIGLRVRECLALIEILEIEIEIEDTTRRLRIDVEADGEIDGPTEPKEANA
jgi:hypothetical protein